MNGIYCLDVCSKCGARLMAPGGRLQVCLRCKITEESVREVLSIEAVQDLQVLHGLDLVSSQYVLGKLSPVRLEIMKELIDDALRSGEEIVFGGPVVRELDL